MKRLVLAIVVAGVATGCAPASNVNVVGPSHACYGAQQAELRRLEQLDLGYGSGVFDETWFYRGGYERITWWGYQNAWWVSFETGGPLGSGCVVSRGST